MKESTFVDQGGDMESPENKKTLVFTKDQDYSGQELNGLAFSAVAEPDWASLADKKIEDEPEFVLAPEERGLKTSAGIILLEDDGRVWIYEPKNHFGGYEHTFPKGRPEPGLSLQQTARKEVLEEIGLLAEVTDFVADVPRTATKTRYYLGKRLGGTPNMADGYRGPDEVEEVWSVKLVSLDRLNQYLNTDIDRKLAEKLREKLSQKKEM